MKGEPDNPLTDDELREKARRDCVRFGGFPENAMERLSMWVSGLDSAQHPLRELHSIFRDEGTD